MHEIIFHESFSLKKTNEYKLSIQVSLDGFSFSVINENRNRLLAFKQTPLKISNEKFISRRFQEWFETEDLFRQPFGEVNVVINTPYFTFIPDLFFAEEYNTTIFHSIFEMKDEVEIGRNLIERFNTNLLFAIPKQLQEILLQTHGNATFLHPSKIIASQFPKLNGKNGLVLFFNTKEFYALLFNEQELLIGNSFKITHPNDTVFYILTLLKQFKVSTKNTHLFLAGNPAEMNVSENELIKYFSEIERMQPNNEIEILSGVTNDDKTLLLTLLL